VLSRIIYKGVFQGMNIPFNALFGALRACAMMLVMEQNKQMSNSDFFMRARIVYYDDL